MEGKGLIVKKIKKRSQEGSHSSAWKVAYADFVTAMMAFFLLLWLITMVEPEKRERLANYFKTFSIFEKGGVSMIDSTLRMDLIDVMSERGRSTTDLSRVLIRKQISPEKLKERLKNEIETRLSDVKEQVLVEIFEGGVRIQIMDNEGKPMFPLGSPELTPRAKMILKVIAENIRDLENKISIEGHTDAFGYPTNKFTNWELSTERASSARRELEANGIDPQRLIRVAGFAATDPLIKENPYDPRNRRISILIFSYYKNI